MKFHVQIHDFFPSHSTYFMNILRVPARSSYDFENKKVQECVVTFHKTLHQRWQRFKVICMQVTASV